MFRSEKAPVVPPGPTEQEVNKHIQSSVPKETKVENKENAVGAVINPQNKSSGMMGALEKMNPFRSSPQSSLSESKPPPTGEVNGGGVKEPSQNTGMVSGFIQMVNPFKSSSQISKSSSQSSLTGKSGENKASEPAQNPGLVLGLIQKVNPFRTSQNPNNGLPSQNTDRTQQSADVAEGVKEDVSMNKDRVQESDLKSVQKDEDPAADQRGSTASQSLTEPSSPKILGFEWDHFKKDSLEVPAVEEVSAPGEDSPQQTDEDEEGLLEWWGTVEGWNEWNESTNFEGEEAEQAVEAAADRVFMAARLFVHLFNQREATLHHRVAELLALADAADSFHKKTAGMETLEEWNFEQYLDSISKRAMNKSVKHVMKEGGRAGKALLINTESLVSTVQVLGAAGGAAKAAQVVTVASGVMSGLFLALDVFFLAKDSMELRKGAKTEFAAKIREVCKELQDGLQELKKIKVQLEDIMEDIEEEVEEEEVEEEVEEEEEEEEEKPEKNQRETVESVAEKKEEKS